ncbi:hypothetical protein DDZ18_03610 [Marinicauda salina]|uniref:Nucleotidyl transferase domain-containing protein n=1 Tax=Marinicauda salina TaxID=2135793 RepID=A0A2U2BXG4_9PROT|nr:AGE family epimerase/isomerase [Marinicauda salina]PWE18690.1 hypothetical protein DDZ18_03610 [Marinicauda salina]
MKRDGMLQPVILCGGRGTRLWPISSVQRPKPFLALNSSHTMLRETANRVAGPTHCGLDFAPACVIGSARNRALVRRELPDAPLILEPAPRNSAPAVAAAALSWPDDTLILILPADHYIRDTAALHRAIKAGAEAAAQGKIVTLGLKPDHAQAGYGYIRTPRDTPLERAAPAEAFIEKPNQDVAQKYLESGDHLWNSGILIFRGDAMLEAFERHAPDIVASVRAAGENALPPRAGAEARLDPVAFSRCRSESVDYALMEKAESAAVVPVDMGWSDIGDFAKLHAVKAASPEANVCEGPVFARESSGCYLRSDGPVIAVHGLNGVAVAATPRGVIVTRLSEADTTRSLTKDAARRGFAASISNDTIDRVRRWLFSACLPHWADNAWDPKHGGFVEALDLNGRPLAKLDRRGRVLPRQIYSFSQALNLGWSDDRARRLVADGLDYIDTRARSPGGGWASSLGPEGEILSSTPALYDHAFIVLAGAAAFKATGESQARELAEEALDFIDAKLRDRTHGGFFDTAASPDRRRSNPHMHLLEACLALHEATGETRARELALEVVELFETRFFDPRSNALAENFTREWAREPGAEGDLVEPGHCYEWSVLLGFFEEETGRDLLSWRRRLISFADRVGRNDQGFAVDAVDRQARVIRGGRRLWPQLEMFRAKLFHPETAPPGEAGRILERVMSSYLADGPDGGWMDSYDDKGRPDAFTVPASMLYHMLTAFTPLFESEAR